MPPENGLLALARRMQQGLAPDPAALRGALEDSLLPIVRVALRGVGPPGLVNWAREEGPGAPARDLARRLCDRLMERLDPLSARETVADH